MKKKYLFIGIPILIGIAVLLFFLLRPVWQEISVHFSSVEALRQFIEGFGFWAPLMFILLQIIQVVVSVIPGNVAMLAGGIVFGAWPGFVYSSIGSLTGSLIAFFLARRFGQALVVRFIGEKHFAKYNQMATGKFSISLLILFLLPFFPNDILCFLLGLSTMSLPTYAFFLVAGRLPNALVISLVGGGVITLDFWQWVIVGGVSIVLGAVFFLYSQKIEAWLRRNATKGSASDSALSLAQSTPANVVSGYGNEAVDIDQTIKLSPREIQRRIEQRRRKVVNSIKPSGVERRYKTMALE